MLLEEAGYGGEECVVGKSLRQLWLTPPVPEFGCEVEAARLLLFWPNDDDGAKYACLLEKKSKKALAVLFALQQKRSIGFWFSFVLGGGLLALGSGFSAEDSYQRAHFVEIFLRLTSLEDLFDNKDLQKALLDMGRPSASPLLALLANSNDSYPGGERSCLQALAFWLSSARQVNPKGFRVSRRFLSGLSDWVNFAAERGDADECELAQQLFDDFSRHPLHDGMGLVDGCFDLFDEDDDSSEDIMVVVEEDDRGGGFDISKESHAAVVVEEPTIMRHRLPEIILTPRDQGNRAFAAGDFSGAISAYTVALSETKDEKQRAALFCNRALCSLKVDDARAAANDCERAINCDPSNAKAKYRFACALDALGDYWRASRAAREALALLDNAPPTQRAQTEKLVVDLATKAASLSGKKEDSDNQSAAEKRRARLVAQFAKQREPPCDTKPRNFLADFSLKPKELDEPCHPEETLVPQVDHEDSDVDSDDDDVINAALATMPPEDPHLVFPTDPPSQTNKKLQKKLQKKTANLLASLHSEDTIITTSDTKKKKKMMAKPTAEERAARAQRILARHCYSSA